MRSPARTSTTVRRPRGANAAARPDDVATRRRLLDAAGFVFADAGYERARVRDICARAGANIAAINYHFGGKYPLYEQAVGFWFDHQSEFTVARADPTKVDLSDPEAALARFVAGFVAHLLDPEKPAWHARLMAREMVEPTGVLDEMVRRAMKPTLARLERIVRAFVGDDCPRVDVEYAMLSVIAQCVFYHHCRPVLERVFPAHAARPDVAAIAAHIVRFSAAGLRAIARRNGAKPVRKRARSS